MYGRNTSRPPSVLSGDTKEELIERGGLVRLVRTDIEDEVAAFLIGYDAVGIFGVLSDVEFDDKTLIFRSVRVSLQSVSQILVTYDIREASVCRGMQILLEKTFHVCRPSFVKPKVSSFSIAAGDCTVLNYIMNRNLQRQYARNPVAEPRMCQFVNYYINESAITRQ